MIDLDHLLAPAFAVFSREATFEPRDGSPARTIRVVDDTDGAQIDVGNGVYGIIPAATARAADLPANPSGGTLVLNGRRWEVRSFRHELTNGEGTGEIVLELQEKS